MADSPYYRNRWLNLEPEKQAHYEKLFQWSEGSSIFYEPAGISAGHSVGELGSGPGYTAVEIAKWVGETGSVCTFDINEEFVALTRLNAEAAGVGERITPHLCDGSFLPAEDAQFDRMTVRNALLYVDDVVTTLKEFKRVLKPGGIAHAIEGDWPMMIVEPIPTDEWADVMRAASFACRTPKIGRELYGYFKQAGFEDITVQLLTRPDTTGRLLGALQNMMGYAVKSGEIDEAQIEKIAKSIDEAISAGTYLALAPQFVVTAKA